MTAAPSGTARPPRRGSRAYLRTLLYVVATEDAGEFLERWGEELIPLGGWITGVDIIVEIARGLERATPSKARDAFGKVPLKELTALMTDETTVELASHVAHVEARREGIPLHEAFQSALATGEKMQRESARLRVAFGDALASLRRTGGDRAPAVAAVLRHYPVGERHESVLTAAALVHPVLRSMAFPAGDDWVEAYLAEPAHASEGSVAVYDRMDDVALSRHVPPWLLEEGPPEPSGGSRAERRRRKKGGGCGSPFCPHCGGS